MPPKLLTNERLHKYVVKHLKFHWAPEEIAARVKLAYPSDMEMRVSHETIYTYSYCHARGELKKVQHLLNGRPRKILGFHTPYEAFSLAEKP